MGSGEEPQLAGRGSAAGETDRHHDGRTVAGVPAHAAVAMPRKIGQPLGHRRALPQDRHGVTTRAARRPGGDRAPPTRSAAAVGPGAAPASRGRLAARRTRVSTSSPSALRPHHDASSSGRASASNTSRVRHHLRDLGAHRTRPVPTGTPRSANWWRTSSRVGLDVLQPERPGGVERVARPVAQVGRLRIEHRNPVEQGAQAGLPPDEPQRLAAGDLGPAAVQQPRRGVQVRDQTQPRVQIHLDHGVGVLLTLEDRHRTALGSVGVAAGRSPQTDRTEPLHIGERQRPVARCDPLRKVDGVEPVERGCVSVELSDRHDSTLPPLPRDLQRWSSAGPSVG